MPTRGATRICAELADDYNIRCGRKRVARLMRQAGIAGCHRRKRIWTTRRVWVPETRPWSLMCRDAGRC